MAERRGGGDFRRSSPPRESVAWITERKDVLSGVFFMLTLGAYVRYVHRPFSWVRYSWVTVFFISGLMSKAILVTTPFVLLLLDYWPLGRTAWLASPVLPGGQSVKAYRLVLEKTPWLAISVACCVLTVSIQGETLISTQVYPVWWRIGNALVMYVVYLRQFFYPANLAVIYPRLDAELSTWQGLTAGLILAAITVTVAACRKKQPYLLVGWLWYLGMLTPVIGLWQVGMTTQADRFTYLPEIGLSIALTWGAAALCRSWPYRRWVCGAASALVLIVLAGAAWQQTSYWGDDETLWSHTLKSTSRNMIAHTMLAGILEESGRLDEAMEHYRQAVDIAPANPVPRVRLGGLLVGLNRKNEAIMHFQKAMEHFQGVEAPFDDADTHFHLGLCLAELNRFDEACKEYERSLALDPDDSLAQNNYAYLLATCPEDSLRRGAKAVEMARRVNDASGGKQPEVLDTLAAAYAETGQFAEAVRTARLAHRSRRGEEDASPSSRTCKCGSNCTNKASRSTSRRRRCQAKRRSKNDSGLWRATNPPQSVFGKPMLTVPPPLGKGRPLKHVLTSPGVPYSSIGGGILGTQYKNSLQRSPRLWVSSKRDCNPALGCP